MTIKDYVKFFRDKYKAWMPEWAVRKFIKEGHIDYVRNGGRIYVVIDPKSMEQTVKRLPKSTKFLYNVEDKKPARWMTPRQAFSKGF